MLSLDPKENMKAAMLPTKVNLFATKSAVYSMYKFAIFDLETTGLSHKSDDIVEIAVSTMIDGVISERFHSYIKTEKILSPQVTAINKITNAMLANASNCSEVLNRVYHDFSGHVFVAHNAHNFDAKFLINKAPTLYSSCKFLDTRELAKHVLPGFSAEKTDSPTQHSTGYSNGNLCKLFGIEIKNQHTARGDVAALSLLFKKLLSLIDPNEISLFIKDGSAIEKSI